jgi:hypothetical protein
MMSATVEAVDHSVGRPLELIVKATRDKPTDDRLRCALTIEREVDDAPFDPLLGKSAMDTLDDVAALTQCAQ